MLPLLGLANRFSLLFDLSFFVFSFSLQVRNLQFLCIHLSIQVIDHLLLVCQLYAQLLQIKCQCGLLQIQAMHIFLAVINLLVCCAENFVDCLSLRTCMLLILAKRSVVKFVRLVCCDVLQSA